MHDATEIARPQRGRTPSADVRTDHLLLALVQRGDRGALEELYRRYAGRLGRLVAPRTSALYDADDVVQSAFRTFITSADSGLYDLPDGRDLWGLLVVIAFNKLRSRARYDAARKRRPADGRGPAALDDVSAAGDPVGEVVDVRDALERLPPEERELVELRVAGHVVDDIARRVGRSKRTVERQLQSCRDTLAKLVAADA